MKLFLFGIAVFAAVSGPAHAKQWKSGDRSFQSGENQPYVITDGSTSTKCKIQTWPVNSQTATLDCDDGKKHTMELIPPNAIRIDGMLLEPMLD